MISAVLAANVLASGLPANRSSPAEVIEAWIAEQFELVLSEHVPEGTTRAWSKPYFRSRYTPGEVDDALALLRREARLVLPVDTVDGVCDDEEDNLVLATAVAGNAPYLVSGDRGMLNVAQYQGITIHPHPAPSSTCSTSQTSAPSANRHHHIGCQAA